MEQNIIPALIKNNFLPACFGQDFLQLKSGKGVYLKDRDNNSYLDFTSGICVNNLGYGNKELAKAVKKQMKKLAHTSNIFTSSKVIKLAGRIIQDASFSKKMTALHFGNSGTEAVETALKFARLYALENKGEDHFKFLSFSNGFHGRSMGALSVTSKEKYKKAFQPLIPGCIEIPYNDTDALKSTLNKEFAAVIVEPLQGEGGLFQLEKGFINALNELCEQHDVILIADEIQSGIGRLACLFASEKMGLKPDIITLSKPLAAGLPLSATVFTENINKHLQLGHHGTTFGGNPVACAAANIVWKEISDPAFLEKVQEKGFFLNEKLMELKNEFNFIEEVRGMGLLQGLVLKEPTEKEGQMTGKVIKAARERGLLILRSGTNVLRLAPPLIISKMDIIYGIDILRNALKALEMEFDN